MTGERRDPGDEGVHRFDDLDSTTDPSYFVRYLDAAATRPYFRELKRRTYDALGLEAGECVLDVGCGTGEDVQELARLVGAGGRAIGVDLSETMVAEATRRVEDSGLPVEFCVADAATLPLADGSVDGYRSERTYQHVTDPVAALAEASRVLRSHGRIVFAEPDWEMLVVDSSDAELTMRILACHRDATQNGRIGRQLPALMKDAGLLDVKATPFPIVMTDFEGEADLIWSPISEKAVEEGAANTDDAARWLEDLRRRGENDRFFAAAMLFICTARRP
jgi:SAM-dependent methyltransferase